MSTPGLVTLTLWGVPPAAVPAAVLRMALDRRRLRRTPGLRFAKLLGTGDGRTFTVRDADPLHWGLLGVWDDEVAATRFAAGPARRGWDRISRERLDVALRPIASRGRWSGRAPFGDPAPRKVDGPVAALTRARIRARSTRAFWRSVPPVSRDLHAVPGLRLAVGIGEAPIGLQGTFSLWESAAPLVEFAHRRPVHADVVARTTREGWYAEELFARFEVLEIAGTFRGAVRSRRRSGRDRQDAPPRRTAPRLRGCDPGSRSLRDPPSSGVGSGAGSGAPGRRDRGRGSRPTASPDGAAGRRGGGRRRAGPDRLPAARRRRRCGW